MILFRNLVLSGIAALACGLASAAAPAAAAPQAADAGSLVQREPMTFLVAQGEPNACGPGCSEWIAAEGAIDADAPKRLRTLLTSLADRKLPIFFHSPGGLRLPALEIGRLLRGREMTAGVSRTIERELHNIAACHSACVFALIGAKVRQVPPGARIGVHTGKMGRPDFDGRYRAILDERVRRYLRDMGIADTLLEVISRVPHESAHYLSRDEIADFGIDTSAFQETRWTAIEWPWAGTEWPPQRFSVVKFVVEARGEERKRYRATAIRLSCAGPERVGLRYFRRLASREIAGAGSIELSVEGERLSLRREASMSKIDPLETGWFEARYTSAPLAFDQAAATRDSIDIVESDATDPVASPHIVKLSTDGLSKALEQLKKACDPRKSLGVRATPAVKSIAKLGGQ